MSSKSAAPKAKRNQKNNLSREDINQSSQNESPAPATASVTPATVPKVTNLSAFRRALQSPKVTDTLAGNTTNPTPAKPSRWEIGPEIGMPTDDPMWPLVQSSPDSPKTVERKKGVTKRKLLVAIRKRDQGIRLSSLEFAILAANDKEVALADGQPDEGSAEEATDPVDDGRSDEDRASPSSDHQQSDEPSEGESHRRGLGYGNPDSESDPVEEDLDSGADQFRRKGNRFTADGEDRHEFKDDGEFPNSQQLFSDSDDSQYTHSSGLAQSSQFSSQAPKRRRSSSNHRGTSPKRRRHNDRQRNSPDRDRQRHSRDSSREREHFRSPQHQHRYSQRRDSRDHRSDSQSPQHRDSQRRDSRDRQPNSQSSHRQRHGSQRSASRDRRRDSRDRGQHRRRSNSRDRSKLNIRQLERYTPSRRSHSRDRPYRHGRDPKGDDTAYGPEYWRDAYLTNHYGFKGDPTWYQVAGKRWDFTDLLFDTLLAKGGIDRPTFAQQLRGKSHSVKYALEHYTTREVGDTIAEAIRQRSAEASTAQGTSNAGYMRVSGSIPVLTDSEHPEIIESWCEKVTMEWKGGKRYSILESVRDSTIDSLKILFAGTGYATDEPNWDVKWSVPQLVAQLRLAFPRKGTASTTLGMVDTVKRIYPTIGMVPSVTQIAKYVSDVTAVITAGKHLGTFNQKLASTVIMNNIVAPRDSDGTPRTVTHVALRLHEQLKASNPPIVTVTDMLTSITRIIAEAEKSIGNSSPWLPPGTLTAATIANPASGRKPHNATPAQGPGEHRVNPRNECNYLCFGCGKDYQGNGLRCMSCTEHPDRNMEDCPFTESEAYKAQLRCDKIFTKHHLYSKHRANGDPFTAEEWARIEAGKEQRRNTRNRVNNTGPNRDSGGNRNNTGPNRDGGGNNNSSANNGGNQRPAHRPQYARTQPHGESNSRSHYQNPNTSTG